MTILNINQGIRINEDIITIDMSLENFEIIKQAIRFANGEISGIEITDTLNAISYDFKAFMVWKGN